MIILFYECFWTWWHQICIYFYVFVLLYNKSMFNGGKKYFYFYILMESSCHNFLYYSWYCQHFIYDFIDYILNFLQNFSFFFMEFFLAMQYENCVIFLLIFMVTKVNVKYFYSFRHNCAWTDITATKSIHERKAKAL